MEMVREILNYHLHIGGGMLPVSIGDLIFQLVIPLAVVFAGIRLVRFLFRKLFDSIDIDQDMKENSLRRRRGAISSPSVSISTNGTPKSCLPVGTVTV